MRGQDANGDIPHGRDFRVDEMIVARGSLTPISGSIHKFRAPNYPKSFRGYDVHETSTRRALEKFVQRIYSDDDWPG